MPMFRYSIFFLSLLILPARANLGDDVKQLVARYGTPITFSEPTPTNPFGTIVFQAGVDACLTADGLHLKMFLTCRFMHPPLLIPWSDIAPISAKEIFFVSLYEVRIRQTGATMGFSGELGKAIFKELQERSPASQSFR